VSKTTRVEQLLAKERQLRQEIENVESMLAAIDGSRTRFESGLDGLTMSAEEMKGQQRILKERQMWLIGEQDKLRAEIRRTTNPGDSK